MFIGHYAPALIAAASPRAQPLGALFVAAQLVDLAFFTLVLLGVEHMRAVPGFTAMNAMDLYHMPFTHSLLGTLAFAAGWTIVTRLAGGGKAAAAIGGAVVASHWLLDLLVHAPDLTIAGGTTRYGLGLWNRPAIEMPFELLLVGVGFAIYARNTRGPIGPLVLLGVALLGVQAFNWLEPQPARVIDPVPVSQPLLALAAYVVLALLASWVAQTRVVRAGPRVRGL